MVCAGVDAPGGIIWSNERWLVDHCVGPLGVGTLIVKPVRHETSMGGLTEREANDLGPLLKRAAAVVKDLANADQVYVCLWSHAGFVPGHIHFVVQPTTNAMSQSYTHPGPSIQEAMFEAGVLPDPEAAAKFATRARDILKGS